MTERRFHIDRALTVGGEVTLPDAAARHARVLRLGPGAPIVLFDGRGNEAEATLTGDGTARVLSLRAALEPWRVVLVAALPKATALDALLRGATEAGASELRLFAAARSVSQPDAARAAHKLERARRVVEEAARQSERAIVPPLRLDASLEGALQDRGEASLLLALDARAGEDLEEVLGPSCSEIWLVLGPEGGLDPAELAGLEARGARCVRAALPVLRVETAAAVLTARAVLASGRNRRETPQMR